MPTSSSTPCSRDRTEVVPVKLLARLLYLPVKLGLSAVESAFQAGRFAGEVSVSAGRGTTRLLGVRGTLALLLGIGLGLAFAPVPGRDLRARVKAWLARRPGVSDADIADRVTFELEHAPRTWHLPQPTVTVARGRVVLGGHVAHESSRGELGRVAAAVPGVSGVDNLIEVADDLAGAAVEAD
jgi:hypothetical protein